jgi:hypothetical protein
MKLTDGKGIKTNKWYPHEVLWDSDLNFESGSQYKTVTDILALFTQKNDNIDTVISGIHLVWDTLLTCHLEAGAAISFSGYYLSESEVWGFHASAGDIFSCLVGDETVVAFDAGDGSDRIDVVEIRPIQTSYSSASRQFIDPITSLETSAVVDTKLEYGFEFQIIKGTPGAGVAPSKTSGWIKIAEVTVVASASSISQSDIKDVSQSAEWTTDISSTAELGTHVLSLDSTASIDLSKYDGDLLIYGSTAGTIILTISNSLPEGSRLTVINVSTGIVTLAGISTLSLSSGQAIPFIADSSTMRNIPKINDIGQALIDSATPSDAAAVIRSILSLSGSDYTVLDNDGYTRIDATCGGSNITITLPTAADNDRRELFIRKLDAKDQGYVSIVGEGTEKIGGSHTRTLSTSNDWIRISCDGTGWQVIGFSIERFIRNAIPYNITTLIPGTVTGLGGVAWSPELKLFAAVGPNGSYVRTSSDGINWASHSCTSNSWIHICWSPELELFAAVANTTGSSQVMTSPDGSTWTDRTTPSGKGPWRSICWSPSLGLFVAVATDGSGTQAMTSSNGTDWNIQSTPGAIRYWKSVCWSEELGLFVAVSFDHGGSAIMTSPDGSTWTDRTSPSSDIYNGVCWSPELGLFVAVGGAGNAVSSNGIDWTHVDVPSINLWYSVAWSPELKLFLAVAYTASADGTKMAMVSVDGINWIAVPLTNIIGSDTVGWSDLVWSPALGGFLAVGSHTTSTHNDYIAMTPLS